MKSNVKLGQIKKFLGKVLGSDVDELCEKQVARLECFINYPITNGSNYDSFDFLGKGKNYSMDTLFNIYGHGSIDKPTHLEIIITKSWGGYDKFYITDTTCTHVYDDVEQYRSYAAPKTDDLTLDMQAYLMENVSGYAEYLIERNKNLINEENNDIDASIRFYQEKIDSLKKENKEVQNNLKQSIKHAEKFLAKLSTLGK